MAKSFMPPIAQPGVVGAQIRRLAGFDIFETTILPENGEKLVGFAAHPSGLAVAMRYLEPVAEYDEAGAVLLTRRQASPSATCVTQKRRATASSSRLSVSTVSRSPSPPASSGS